MARTVLVVTDRPSFAATCEPAFSLTGALPRVVDPSDLTSEIAQHDAVLFDSESVAYRAQDDELLVALGFARALHATVAVASTSTRVGEIDDLVAELCPGLVAHSTAALAETIARLIKRADGTAVPRFEYVTVSPRANELLAILSNGQASVLSRPCNETDDGSDVVAIDLAQDAAFATLTLESGSALVLTAESVAPRREGLNGVSHGAALDGAKVGSRLRELRKAAGLTQAELARRTGIHRPNIARVEAGRHTPSLDTLARIAAAIGVPATRVLSAE